MGPRDSNRKRVGETAVPPCRKLFKTEGFEGVPIYRDDVRFPPSPQKIESSFRDDFIFGDWESNCEPPCWKIGT